ncbi:cytochrome P450 [Streptosporangium carneum]|uniref:Cytochrome P450 n=1 Tax=Streptosporangium carneum TaxID=47481 RepID=A0A9W6I5L0_9ACTN|nr:cytochrome P450 [Streptosporangium carneum]GLK11871.1 cytochrome P450 [Streptosporangium carneum]
MVSSPLDLTGVDLTDLDAFERNRAWERFDLLRREDPVHWNPEPAPNAGFWSITRHEDIVAVDRDAETFTSTRFVNLEEVDDDLIKIRRSMLESDGVRHRALRRLLQRDFGARALQRYEEFLRGLTRATVDAALHKREFDFVREISADFPIQVLARMLDVPEDHTGQLIDWGNKMIGNNDPDYADVLLSDAESEKYKHLPFRSPSALEVFEYGRELARRRRGGDGDDLVSKLVNRVPQDGEPLTATEFDNYFLLLVVAGNETTRHAISHSMLALIDNPDQLALLRDRPELIPAAVEELLRWASPVYHFRRTATRDVELHGRRVRAGDKVVMWFASGNRDEEVFAKPYELDVTRTPNDHLAFGKGSPHFCLGNSLARMEMRLMFETLLPRLESIERAGEVTYVRSNFVNGVKRFPVRVTAR